jgi:hypothetical protein
MVRSSGFGSTNGDLRSIQARFHYGFSIFYFNLPPPVSRRLILQQARSQTISRSSTACGLAISCSLSLPSRGSFHLSLTVLCAIGHLGIFSLTRWSSQIHTGFHVPHATREKTRKRIFGYKTITFYGKVFQLFHLIL